PHPTYSLSLHDALPISSEIISQTPDAESDIDSITLTNSFSILAPFSSQKSVILPQISTIKSRIADTACVTLSRTPSNVSPILSRSEEHTSELQSRFDIV